MTLPSKIFHHCLQRPNQMLGCSSTLLIRKKLFNSKYPQLLVAKDFAVVEKKLHLAVSGRNTIQERKHQKENIPQIKRQQTPNHQLHRISHKMSPFLNNSHQISPSLNNSHKTNPPRNSSHKVHPPLKNDHKVKRTLILSSHSSAVMMNHFQIMAQLSELFQ